MIILRSFLIISALLSLSTMTGNVLPELRNYFLQGTGGGFHYAMFAPIISPKKYSVLITINNEAHDWTKIVPHSLRMNFLRILTMDLGQFRAEKVKEKRVNEFLQDLKKNKKADKVSLTVLLYEVKPDSSSEAITLWERSL